MGLRSVAARRILRISFARSRDLGVLIYARKVGDSSTGSAEPLLLARRCSSEVVFVFRC